MGVTWADMLRIRAESGCSADELSRYSGVSVEIIQKFLDGGSADALETTLPVSEEVQPDSETKHSDQPYTFETGIRSIMVAEPLSTYGIKHAKKQQGEYTIEDYYHMPDDRRIELIDGVIYDMSAPTPLHQMIAGMMYARILAFIEKEKGDCIPFIAPADVQLDCDTRTMVQPDVFILCKKDRLKRFGIFGAPDFVLEILSGSTRKKDMTVKLTKYMEAGVREYWVIDPEKRLLVVYIGEEEGIPRLYPLQGEVSVNLYHGRLKINLNEINALIDQFGALGE